MRLFPFSALLALVAVVVTSDTQTYDVAGKNPETLEALIKIRNDWIDDMHNVTLIFKSGDYKPIIFKWKQISVGQATPETGLTQYKSDPSIGETDLWHMSWSNAQGTFLYYSIPNDLRSFFVMLSFLQVPLSFEAGRVVVASSGREQQGAAIAAKISDRIYASSGRTGFMEHRLKKADAGMVTEIVLGQDRRLNIKSNSGSDRTSILPVQLKCKEPTD